jgi:MFS family permease
VKQLRVKIAKWPYPVISLLAAFSAFGAYTCMYAFRKSFAAGTYDQHSYLQVDYKVWLIIAQLVGYTISKFYGIRFISEASPKFRARYVFILIGIAWLSLLGFAKVPAPWNIVFLFINGLPLGMIWGLIFSYLEGRRSTEFMAAVMSISLIFASGFVKTIGRILITDYGVDEYTMPFATGALFAIPLVLFVMCLELVPKPTPEDVRLRAERVPMDASARKQFLLRFLPGVVLIIVVYVLLTLMRDVRDNFEVEIWADLGIAGSSIYTQVDSFVSLIILLMMSLLILVKDNRQAFRYIHLFILSGFMILGVSTWMFNHHLISPVSWMTMTGIGLYMGYVPFNAIFFERMIATFRYRSNVGFVMYVADSLGYLASIGLMLFKEFGHQNISWTMFFNSGVAYASIIGSSATIILLLYFVNSAQALNKRKFKYGIL